MKKRMKTFILFFCLCALSCGCTLPHRVPTGNSGTIFYELPPDDSIFVDMDMITLSAYHTYHYDTAKNLVQTNYYCPRDTDDGSWGFHERKICSYDNERRIIKEQRFLPYVDNSSPWTETNYVYFTDGYSETCIYSDNGSIESYYDTDGMSTEYTLYDYDKNGNLALKLFYNRLYNEKVNLYRYEYDAWGNMVKQYKYDIDFERYKEWSLPLSNGETFHFSYGNDRTLIMKRLSASQEVLSAMHCESSRFHMQYIGDEEIRWK